MHIHGRPVEPRDISGTIQTGGTPQTIAARDPARSGFWLQNQSAGDLWLNMTGTAAAGSGSLRIPAGALYEAPMHGVPIGAISLFGAAAGQAYAARVW